MALTEDDLDRRLSAAAIVFNVNVFLNAAIDGTELAIENPDLVESYDFSRGTQAAFRAVREYMVRLDAARFELP